MPYNILVQGRSNDGQTLGLIILMLDKVNAQQQSTQILFVTATREAAKETFNKANDLSNKMGGGVRCYLANFDQPVDVKGKFHCIIGTTKSIENHLSEELNFSLRMVLFDDCNKSMSYDTELMKFGAKYVCVTSYSSKALKETCNQQLQTKQFSLPLNRAISANLRHIEFCCSSIDEKLYVTAQLCS